MQNNSTQFFYDQNKNKVSEGKVVNKLFEGQWKYYHQASKNIMTTENYKG
jgi:antitoxin component YwqK of YwqJK toxin-antitoxin module